MKSGMEYPFDGLLINESNRGIAMILLNQEGLVLTQSMEKMNVDNTRPVIFYPNEDIIDIEIKRFSLLNNKAKRISIETKDGKYYRLYTKAVEKNIPYQQENFDKFVQKHQ